MDSLYAFLASQAAAGHLPAAFGYAFVVRGMIAVLAIAPLLGGLSHLVVARRLAFFSAALGQAALTGLTIGVVLGEPLESPYGGIAGFCLLSALAMVYVRRHSGLPPDTLVGVFLALTLGLGICLLVAVTRRFNVHQIEAVMFGSLLTVADRDLALLAIFGIAVLVVTAVLYNRIALDSLDPALSRASGLGSDALEYAFVALLTAAIVVSLKIVGALLVETLVVVPAAAARNLAKTTRGLLIWSIVLAAIAGEGGILVSSALPVPSGGAVVLGLGFVFVLAFAARRLRPR
jgi:zinc transport system permease protein